MKKLFFAHCFIFVFQYKKENPLRDTKINKKKTLSFNKKESFQNKKRRKKEGVHKEERRKDVTKKENKE